MKLKKRKGGVMARSKNVVQLSRVTAALGAEVHEMFQRAKSTQGTVPSNPATSQGRKAWLVLTLPTIKQEHDNDNTERSSHPPPESRRSPFLETRERQQRATLPVS